MSILLEEVVQEYGLPVVYECDAASGWTTPDGGAFILCPDGSGGHRRFRFQLAKDMWQLFRQRIFSGYDKQFAEILNSADEIRTSSSKTNKISDYLRPGVLRDVIARIECGEKLTRSDTRKMGRKLTNLKADVRRWKNGRDLREKILSMLNCIGDN